jgi:RNase P subunit RPR2
MNAILKSTTGLCPKCRDIRNFVVNTERQEARTADGGIKAIEIVVTSCESCGSFISRESREVADRKL